MCAQVRRCLVPEQLHVDNLPGHALYRAYAVNSLCQRASGDRVGVMRYDEGHPGARQPNDADEEQDRQDRQRQQTQLPVQPQHAADDAKQQHQITHRNDRRFQEFLHRVHVALQPRHQAADLGLIHEALRHALQMGEHRLANVEQHVLGDPPHQLFLREAGQEVDEDRHGKGQDRPDEGASPVGDQKALVDRGTDDDRDRQLRQREDQDRNHRDYQLSAIRPNKDPDAAHDIGVEDTAEHLFLDAVRTDYGARGAAAVFAHFVALHLVLAAHGRSPKE